MAVSRRTGKIGSDGLSDRERAFVEHRRKDPGATAAEIARRAGFIGDQQRLTERARVIMKKKAVALAVTAPMVTAPPELLDETLREEIRQKFRTILLDPRATHADIIKAGDRLLATIPGGFVPVQIQQRGSVTLESWVRGMGGAPDDQPQEEVKPTTPTH